MCVCVCFDVYQCECATVRPRGGKATCTLPERAAWTVPQVHLRPAQATIEPTRTMLTMARRGWNGTGQNGATIMVVVRTHGAMGVMHRHAGQTDGKKPLSAPELQEGVPL